jgi:hypothetical protein
MVWDIAIAVLDKVITLGIKRIIPPIRAYPKRIYFTKGEWTSTISFFITNKSKRILFDTYVLLDIKNAVTEDFEIRKEIAPTRLEMKIGNIVINYEAITFCCTDGDKDFILIKISQIPPESSIPFQIKANTNGKIKFKILQYSKNQERVLSQPQKGAVSFMIPKGATKKKKVTPKSMKVMLRKE